MRVLFDISHPAQVHFYRELRSELDAEGHATLVVGRDKDVTLPLLRDYQIPHVTVGRAVHRRRIGQAAELLRRDWVLWRLGRRFRPHVVLTHNPAGVQAARLLRVPGVFETHDGRAAGIHFHAARPFATIIASPASLGERYGPRHRTYRAQPVRACLHPDRFTPDPSIRAHLAGDGPIFLLRFVANTAAHDTGSIGIQPQLRRELVRRLLPHGHVLISDEQPLQPDLAPFAYPLPARRMHDLLAACHLVITDSGTMAAEAAVLGTHVLRMSSWRGPDNYLGELDETYGLVERFDPTEEAALLAAVDQAIADLDGLALGSAKAAERLLEGMVDVTGWYRTLLDELCRSARA
jgi:uncharacterized protein